ncbi:hypothetical protein B0T16DRAFT_491305 [Cercophora newfieldiana]|uniref:C2H2-type domain-containing protein n=1 Tax=Cercophora newfieldiana TaxID=92897 RepID=A0AA39Y9P1_9PEZI|nr:hypothetical protein B0T16DRAFT_491305 [Cercophora newfieldiana]
MSLQQLKVAPEWQIRAILIALCDDDDVCKKALDYHNKINNGQKYPSPDTKICVQCENAFQEAHNTAKSCRYHNGYLAPDYDSDFWADHDEDCHGTIDSDFCRKAYPGGFVWDCCDAHGDEEGGCRMSRHEADPDKNKRRGLGDAASECSYNSDQFHEESEDDEGEEDEENSKDDEDGEESEEEDGRAKKRMKV